jgi:hypothetical protein
MTFLIRLFSRLRRNPDNMTTYLMSRCGSTCVAQRHGSEMFCEVCHLCWDANAPAPKRFFQD